MVKCFYKGCKTHGKAVGKYAGKNLYYCSKHIETYERFKKELEKCKNFKTTYEKRLIQRSITKQRRKQK